MLFLAAVPVFVGGRFLMLKRMSGWQRNRYTKYIRPPPPSALHRVSSRLLANRYWPALTCPGDSDHGLLLATAVEDAVLCWTRLRLLRVPHPHHAR